jgi:hypothetical protein
VSSGAFLVGPEKSTAPSAAVIFVQAAVRRRRKMSGAPGVTRLPRRGRCGARVPPRSAVEGETARHQAQRGDKIDRQSNGVPAALGEGPLNGSQQGPLNGSQHGSFGESRWVASIGADGGRPLSQPKKAEASCATRKPCARDNAALASSSSAWKSECHHWAILGAARRACAKRTRTKFATKIEISAVDEGQLL